MMNPGDLTLMVLGESGSFSIKVPTCSEGFWPTLGRHNDLATAAPSGYGNVGKGMQRSFFGRDEFRTTHDPNRWTSFAYEGPSVGKVKSVTMVVKELEQSHTSRHVAEASCEKQVKIARDMCTALLSDQDGQSADCKKLHGKRRPTYMDMEKKYAVLGLEESQCEQVVAAIHDNTIWGEVARNANLKKVKRRYPAKFMDLLLDQSPEPFRCQWEEHKKEWNRFTPEHGQNELDPSEEVDDSKDDKGEKESDKQSKGISPGCIIGESSTMGAGRGVVVHTLTRTRTPGEYGCKSFLGITWGCSYVDTCKQIFPENPVAEDSLCPIFHGTLPDFMRRQVFVDQLLIVDSSSNPGSLSEVVVKDTIFGAESRTFQVL